MLLDFDPPEDNLPGTGSTQQFLVGTVAKQGTTHQDVTKEDLPATEDTHTAGFKSRN